jgi:cell division protein FtsB
VSEPAAAVRPGRRPARTAKGEAPKASPARRILFFVVGLTAAIVMLAGITGERGYRDVRRQRASLSKLRAEVASLHRENARLLTQVRDLRSDPYVLEQIAREKLGYARPGEIVFQFPAEHPPVPETAPPTVETE